MFDKNGMICYTLGTYNTHFHHKISKQDE